MQYHSKFPRDRRRYRRFELPGSVLLLEPRRPTRAVLRDVSTRGVGIRVVHKSDVGEVMRLLLAVDGRGWLNLRGTVTFVSRGLGTYDVGVDLGLSDAASLARLDNVIGRARTIGSGATGRTVPPPLPSARKPTKDPELEALFAAALAELDSPTSKRTRPR